MQLRTVSPFSLNMYIFFLDLINTGSWAFNATISHYETLYLLLTFYGLVTFLWSDLITPISSLYHFTLLLIGVLANIVSSFSHMGWIEKLLFVCFLIFGAAIDGSQGDAMVAGTVFCDQCKDGQRSLFDYPVYGELLLFFSLIFCFFSKNSFCALM